MLSECFLTVNYPLPNASHKIEAGSNARPCRGTLSIIKTWLDKLMLYCQLPNLFCSICLKTVYQY